MPYHISQRIQSIPDSGLLKFFEILNTMDDVLSLGIGDPDVDTPAVVRDSGVQAIVDGKMGYTANEGIFELRQAIADHIQATYGVTYDPATEILVTVGVSEAMHGAMMALLDPGDSVLMPEPCFVSYEPCIRFANGVPLPIATSAETDWTFSIDQLEEALRPETRILLISYPNNPTGANMTREQLVEVAEFAERHNLIVISDEIYDRFIYTGEHTCFPALDGMRERTILMGGFSKCYAMTGWRIGYACAPHEIIAAMNKVHQYIIMSAPTVAQVGALNALRSADDQSEQIVAEFTARRNVVVQGLKDIGLPCMPPKGAIYAFPSIKHTGMSSMDFSMRLLQEERLAVVPGEAFGTSGEGHVRIAYTLPVPELEEALTRMERFLKGL